MSDRSNKAAAVVLFLSLHLLSCKKDPPVTPPIEPPPYKQSIFLSVADSGLTEVFLSLSFADTLQPRWFEVYRNSSKILSGSLFGKETTLVDTATQLNTKYSYQAYRSENGTKKDSSNIVTTTTLDSTSHVIQWQPPDTLGVQGLIRDVWVFSKNDAWAVGEIYLADSTGKPDIANRYNAAHWDGTTWRMMQIPTAGFVGSGYYPIYTIFAFASNDIWTFSEAGSYSHWNGHGWATAFVAERQGGGIKLWGPSSQSMFLVGTNGSISHFNGSKWTKHNSNTTVNLQDVWGIDNEHVWATGTNNSDGHSVLLQYDGKQWSTLYDNSTATPSTLHYFSTLWTDNAQSLFLDGGSYSQYLNLRQGTFHRTDSLTINAMARLRGIKRNDIFRVGFGGEAVHYNGNHWHIYSELKMLNNGFAGLTSVHANNEFVLIGGLYLTALNGFPVVVRGYR